MSRSTNIIPTGVDLEYNRAPICPYCGCAMRDAWELGDDPDKVDCGACGETYKVERHVEVTYSTSKIPADGEE